MDELFEKFERGEMPNFIELMAAISEISDMWPGDVCLDCRVENDYCQSQTKGAQNGWNQTATGNPRLDS